MSNQPVGARLGWSTYTGIKGLTTLALNVDYGFEDRRRRFLDVAGHAAGHRCEVVGGGRATRRTTARTGCQLAFRQEFFKDADGARTGFGNSARSYWPSTVTAQFKIWKGWSGRRSTGTTRPSEKVYKAAHHPPRRVRRRGGAVQELGHDLRSASTTRSSNRRGPRRPPSIPNGARAEPAPRADLSALTVHAIALDA